MKTPKILLRIASALMLIHVLGHTVGFSGWKKPTDPVQQEVIRQMTGPKFPFMGVTRSMGEYYDGFGYGCTVGMLLFILVLWFVSGELYAAPGLAKKLLLSVALCLLAWGIDELIFFFPFAACLTLLAFVLTLTAFFLYKPGYVAVKES
jgi:hypothetical protein